MGQGALFTTRTAFAVLALAGALLLVGRLQSERRLDAAVRAQSVGRESDAVRLARDADGPTTRDRAHRVAAVAALQLGELRAATREMGAAVRASPDDWSLRLDHAVLLRRSGRRGAAAREMEAALALNPRLPLPPGFSR